MKRRLVAGLTVGGLVLAATGVLWCVQYQEASAHCQMPCGIYDDAARVAQLREDATTIEKAMNQITELAKSHEAQAFNQAARWVQTKEDHAGHVIELVSEYFLAQRVKPAAPGSAEYDGYVKSLADHHAVMVAAMKCKQNVDLSFLSKLNKSIDAMAAHYK